MRDEVKFLYKVPPRITSSQNKKKIELSRSNTDKPLLHWTRSKRWKNILQKNLRENLSLPKRRGHTRVREHWPKNVAINCLLAKRRDRKARYEGTRQFVGHECQREGTRVPSSRLVTSWNSARSEPKRNETKRGERDVVWNLPRPPGTIERTNDAVCGSNGSSNWIVTYVWLVSRCTCEISPREDPRVLETRGSGGSNGDGSRGNRPDPRFSFSLSLSCSLLLGLEE